MKYKFRQGDIKTIETNTKTRDFYFGLFVDLICLEFSLGILTSSSGVCVALDRNICDISRNVFELMNQFSSLEKILLYIPYGDNTSTHSLTHYSYLKVTSSGSNANNDNVIILPMTKRNSLFLLPMFPHLLCTCTMFHPFK